MERLDRGLVRGFVVADERDHDLARSRIRLLAHDDDVAVEDPGLDHRLAFHAQEEVGVAAERLRNRDLVLDCLLGEQRPAGGDAPDEREGRRRRAARRPLLALAADELDSAWLCGITLEQTGTLEVREMRVHRGGRSEADRVADLTDGRWIAVLVDVRGEELPDLLLSCRQHRVSSVGGRTY